MKNKKKLLLGVAAMAAAMYLFSKLSVGDLVAGVITLGFISAMLIAIPAALMVIMSGLTEDNKKFGKTVKGGKALGSIAATILAVGAAVIAIAVAFRVLDKVEDIGRDFFVVAALIAEMTAAIKIISGIKEDELKSVGKVMLVMGGVFVAVGAMLAILSMFDFADLLASAGVMIVAIAVLAIAIYAMNKEIVQNNDKNAYKNLSDFSKSMLMVSAALLPLSVAMMLILGVVGKMNVNPVSAAVTLGAFALLILALAGATSILAESANQNKLKNKGLETYTKALIKLSLALIPVALAAGLLMAALSLTELNGLEALAVLGGLGIVIFAMGAALGLMIEAISQVKNEKLIHSVTVLVLSMCMGLMVIAASVGVAAYAVANSGIDAGRLAITGVILGGMMTFVGIMSAFMLKAIQSMRWNKGSSWKKVVTVLGTYATVCAGLWVLGRALKQVASINSSNLVQAGVAIGIMAGVVTVIVIILNRMQAAPSGALAKMGLFFSVCAGLVIIAKALQMLSTFQFAAIKNNLIAMGAVVLVALAITALLGAFAVLNTQAALTTAGLLLGMGATMAGVGIMLYLFANALNIFLDTMMEVDGKSAKIRGGVGATLTGFFDGLLDALKHVNSMLDTDILPELTKLFDSLFGWLVDEIPKRFGQVLEIIKDSLKSLSEFVNDPEVKESVVGIINGILDLILENAEDWSSKVVQIGVKIGAGICDGINQAFFGGELTGFDDFLFKVGEAIDKNLLGGAITNSANWFTGGIEAQSFVDSWDSSYKQLMIAMTKMAENMGYSEEQMRRAMMKQFKDTEYTGADIIDAAANAVLGAEYYGDETYAQIINEAGGVVAYLSHAVEEVMKNADMSKLTKAFDVDSLYSTTMRDKALASLSEMAESFDKSSPIYWNLTNVGANIQQALYEGWDTEKGHYFRDVATQEIMDAIEACDNEEDRARLFELGKQMGIQFPDGYEYAWNTKNWSTLDRIKNLIIQPIAMMLPTYLSWLQTSGRTIGKAFKTGYDIGFGEEREKTHGKIREFFNFVSGKSNETATSVGTVMGEHWLSILNTKWIDPTWALMNTGAGRSYDIYNAIMAARALIPVNISPKVNMTPSVTVTGTSIPEGTLNTIAGIFKVKLQNAFGAGNFTYTGEMVTSGILGGMINVSSIKKMSSTANSFILSLAKAICKRFDIHSPAEAPEVTEPGENIGAGLLNSIVGYFKKNVDDSANDMAGDTQEALNQSFNDVDLSSVGTTLSDSLTSKMPSWDSLKSNFGWDKGISGNIQGLKNAWSQIKSAFQDENGNFDIGSMFGGVGDSLGSVLSGITDSLNLGDFDMASMGFNFTVDSGFDFSNFNSEFETFDINDMVANNNLDVVMDVDTSMFDDYLDENTTLAMATSTPMGGTYKQSTLGSTYVNNYTYNQTNNSPTALSSREIRRQTELELMRSRNGSRFRSV